MSNKTLAARELLEQIVTWIAAAPDREADPHTTVEVHEAMKRGLGKYTPSELYDIVQRIGDRETHCEVSPFVHTLCNLNRFYTRPE